MDDLIKEYEDKLPHKILEDFKKEVSSRNLNRKQCEKILEYLRNQYDNSKIHPGEAVGIVTAESFGEPSTQMSCRFSEKIIVMINGNVKIVEIGKFVDLLMEMGNPIDYNGSEIANLMHLGIYVPSLDQNEKVQWKKVIECSRHKSPDKLMKLKTKSGRKITATDSHSFVIRKNNLIIPIEGSKLKIGDRIPVISYLDCPIIKEKIQIHRNIPIPLEQLNVIGGNLHKPGTIAKPVVNELPLDHLTGWFMGAYLAEGSATEGHVGISNVNEDYISNAKAFAERIGLDYADRFYEGEYGPGRELRINATLLSKFITASCSKGSDFKKVPDFAYNSGDEFVSGLLRGYFDGDGNFHVDRKMIRTSSNSEELIDGISLLLRRFRIFSFKTKDKKGQHWLLIPYKYAPLFLQFIDSDIDYKRRALEELAEKAKRFWNNRSRDYNDMISGFGNLFYDTAKKVGMMTRYVNNFTKRQKIGRTALYRYINKFEDLAIKNDVDISKELEIMGRMFNSDVIWDEITNIEYVDNKDEYVYDLSVPGLETFTTFEGIVTHNTLNVFHFAGVAEVSVTQGLPRLIELLDARKEISTPSMEICLGKDYKNDVDEVRRVAALIKETKLNEIVTEFSINLNKMQIELTLSRERLKELKINPEQVVSKISEAFKNVNAKSNEDKVIVKLKEAENELMEIYKLKEKLKETYIKGIKEITQVLPVKNKNEYIIITAGSNLKDVLEMKEVDETRTTTNDVHEVAQVLGIEAARNTLIREATKIIEDQGLDVDVRHIMFVADTMTMTGSVKGMTRSGVTGEKRSVLARASFETPLKHIINASLIGEEDELRSVIENVMLNQPVPVGTGLPDLVAKMKKESEVKKK